MAARQQTTHTDGSSVGELKHIKDEQEELWESGEGERLGFPADVPDGVSCKHGLKLQDHLHIKKEEEELWESLEEKQETDITAVTVKSEDEEEEAQCSLLHWRQSEENIKGEPATCSSAKLMKVEPNGDISEGPEAANTCTQQDTDGEETDCSDTEDSEDWREPLSQSEAQSEHMSCENFQTSENNTRGTSHNREKRFGCDICGKRFTDITNLKIHTRIHTGEKPYECDVCGQKFTYKRSFCVHMSYHTGEKPFSCDVCGQSFTYKRSLTVHSRIHTGEKPYGCDVCGQTFTYKESFTSHMSGHTGEKAHKCDVCIKRFNRQSELKQHMRIHTGEKPFGCDVCQRRFPQRSHLKKHVLIHTREKPYVCDVCQKRFSNQTNLNRHMKIHRRHGPCTDPQEAPCGPEPTDSTGYE
ncbi:zinc finger protein 239-like isoform X6 [Gouania willdenowi]|uniref:zinc finger protein 239-like isoform X6 n=1 Tax=Gouania willdenowi TaxID=441366 RepID=UPI0010544EF7|nr:zinc finger protein 239-like isoform X6 [Gouania willdenowi]